MSGRNPVEWKSPLSALALKGDAVERVEQFDKDLLLRLFRERVDVFVRQALELSVEALVTLQQRPWASIADGAGGTAYALLHAARALGWREGLAQAESWFAGLRSGGRYRSAFHWADGSQEQGLLGSLDGIRLAQVLTAHAIGDRKAFNHELRIFLKRCGAQRGGGKELLTGAAGYLNAATLLFRRTGHFGALAVADDLAQDLLEDGPSLVEEGAGYTFAHGRAGILHALLNWSVEGRRNLPLSFFQALDRLEMAGDCPSLRTMPDGARLIVQGSWCKGAAGMALLWAKAFEWTQEERHRSLALEYAWVAQTEIDRAPATLCCGLVGRAYALLAAERIDPGHGWKDRAIALAAAVWEKTPESGLWSKGLLRGHGGWICLVTDLLSDQTDFPLIEA